MVFCVLDVLPPLQGARVSRIRYRKEVKREGNGKEMSYSDKEGGQDKMRRNINAKSTAGFDLKVRFGVIQCCILRCLKYPADRCTGAVSVGG